MLPGSIDTETDPEVKVLKEISLTRANNLELVFHKLGSIIESSVDMKNCV